MSDAQKILLIGLAAVGLVFLVVGFSLMHYIGGFMRTVEEESRREDEGQADKPGQASDETESPSDPNA